MFKILILEDDINLITTLKRVLVKENFQVDLAQKISRAEQLVNEHNYDLLIFDRLIDGIDSATFLEEIKSDRKFLRVLMISQKKLLADRLLALKVADDFLAKPFVIKELLLKVNNLLSRSKLSLEDSYTCPYFFLNDSGILQGIKNGESFYLPKKEKQILECLLLHQNQAVSYQTLIDYVWPSLDKLPQQRTLNVYVRRIRLKIGHFGQYIKTIRDYGFILDCSKEESQ